MMRVSTRFFRGAPRLMCASLIGALAGAMMAQPRAEACDCGVPSWRLTLRAERADGGAPLETDAWPSVARLEAYPGTVMLRSEDDFAAETVEYVHAGAP